MDKKDQNSSLDPSPIGKFVAAPGTKASARMNVPVRLHSSDVDEPDEISLKELILKLHDSLNYLFSRWIIILTISLILGIIGYIYAYYRRPIYTAELTFVLEGGNQGGGLSNYAGLASQFGINMGSVGNGGGVFEGENFLALMKSRLMIEKALLTTISVNNRPMTLAEFYIEITKMRDEWVKNKSKLQHVRFLPGINASDLTIQHNSVIRALYESLISENLLIDKQDKKTSIISLKVKSDNELFSKYFVEILSKEVSQFYVETKTKKSLDNLRILQHQTDSIKRALTGSIMGVAASTDANPNPNPARQVLRVLSQRRQGDVQANQAILTQLVQNLEIAKMSLRTETPLIQVIDRPVLPLPKTVANKVFEAIKWAMTGAFLTILFLIAKRFVNSFNLHSVD